MVDFPEPDWPTIAVHLFGSMMRLKSWRARLSGREGYRKLVLTNCIGTGLATRRQPLCSWDVPWGRLARRSSRVAVSRDELIWGTGKKLARV